MRAEHGTDVEVIYMQILITKGKHIAADVSTVFGALKTRAADEALFQRSR